MVLTNQNVPMPEKTHLVPWREDEESFNYDLPPLLNGLEISNEEYKTSLQEIGREISSVDLKRIIFQKYTKFGILVLTSFVTVLVGLSLWLSIIMKLAVSLFMILFFIFMVVEGVMFIGGMYLSNLVIERIIRRFYENIKLVVRKMNHEIYNKKGVELDLTYISEGYRILPVLKIHVFNVGEPWKKFPAIFL